MGITKTRTQSEPASGLILKTQTRPYYFAGQVRSGGFAIPSHRGRRAVGWVGYLMDLSIIIKPNPDVDSDLLSLLFGYHLTLYVAIATYNVVANHLL